jgi:hypothetical protein
MTAGMKSTDRLTAGEGEGKGRPRRLNREEGRGYRDDWNPNKLIYEIFLLTDIEARMLTFRNFQILLGLPNSSRTSRFFQDFQILPGLPDSSGTN